MKKFGIGLLLFVLAISFALVWQTYRTVDNGLRESREVIAMLDAKLKEETPEGLRMQENLAMWYNLSLRESGDPEPLEAYEGIMNYGDLGMGYIECPQSELLLPIYHGTGEDNAAGGMYHLPQSALPIGGKGNHTVLCGKTGLSDGEMLFDLTDLQPGDLLIIHTLQKECVYRVEDIEAYQRKPNCSVPKAELDLCTLLIQDGDRWIEIRCVRDS